MPTYRFEFESEPSRFDPVGNAEGLGDNAVLGAWCQLEELRGGSMPRGTYRYIPIDPADSEHWSGLKVAANGVVILLIDPWREINMAES
jgi:hypothetical protein